MGQSFVGTITKGFCNNMDNKIQDCTMLAGRVGVMWADGRQADPSNGKTPLTKSAHDINMIKGIYIHHILSSNVNKKETAWFSNCGNPNARSMNVNSITGGSGFLSTGEDSAAVCL
jgi:hypothetical protein